MQGYDHKHMYMPLHAKARADGRQHVAREAELCIWAFRVDAEDSLHTAAKSKELKRVPKCCFFEVRI